MIGVAGGFARLAADLVMRNDAEVVKTLKQQLYHGSITLEQYAQGIAPIKAKFPLIFDFWNIHWLYFCQGLFALTLVLMIVISLMTKAPDPKTVKYTWYGATPEEKAATKASWNAWDVVNTLIVLGAVIAFYIAFF